MYNSTRLNDLKYILNLLCEKSGDFEKHLIISSSQPANFELNQRIKREIIPSIRKYEAEHWELYPQEAIIMSDEEAEKQLVKVEQAITSIQEIPSSNYPLKLISLLQEIGDKLDEKKAASAKLKVVILFLPSLASYELEIGIEGLMYETWKKIKKMLGR